jgi:hypothetical protein
LGSKHSIQGTTLKYSFERQPKITSHITHARSKARTEDVESRLTASINLIISYTTSMDSFEALDRVTKNQSYSSNNIGLVKFSLENGTLQGLKSSCTWRTGMLQGPQKV